ncbi:MAG: PspC domain-containing protein [Alistipes sp.]|nr:PspC domain-containing protein [Alistipes sp.]
MNEIKKCSISGIAFVFEKVAYNRLNEYIESLRRAYKGSDESDEIIADIEARIAELILSAQSNAQQTVCLPLVENIIAQLGSAEDISGSDDEPSEPTTATRIARRLYRDMEGSKLGGVCTGLGRYFSIDPTIIRLLMFSPLLLLPISRISHYIHWLDPLGRNIFGVLIVVYIILWFVVPKAVTARQKLEMEGEPITARSIADRQGKASDEEQAKSTLATFITGLGKFAIVALKALVIILIFPLLLCGVLLVLALCSGVTGIGASLMEFGSLGSLSDAISSYGASLPIFTIGTLLVPIVVIIYTLIVLVIGRRPRWWVYICSLVLWVMLLIGLFTSGAKVVTNMHGVDEVERILKQDWEDSRLQGQMDSMEYNRLLNDPNVQTID